MPDPRYGQQDQMEDASMEGTLAAQAALLWPQERPLMERLGVSRAARVLDLGCGTGRIAGRMAEAWPGVAVTGLDLFEGHLARARHDFPATRLPNLRFVQGDARATGLPAGGFDAVVIRHMLQAIPQPQQVLEEAVRLLAPGGLLYELAEDYQSLLVDSDDPDGRDLFLACADPLLPLGTDMRHGRTAWRRFQALGLQQVRTDPLVIDTGSTPREEWAAMFQHWCDGYAALKARRLGVAREEVERRYAQVIRAVRDPQRWVGWWLIVASGRTPGGPAAS
jgi:ubiquinone/menaquinone biosynthesis C-methylase UbiE